MNHTSSARGIIVGTARESRGTVSRPSDRAGTSAARIVVVVSAALVSVSPPLVPPNVPPPATRLRPSTGHVVDATAPFAATAVRPPHVLVPVRDDRCGDQLRGHVLRVQQRAAVGARHGLPALVHRRSGRVRAPGSGRVASTSRYPRSAQVRALETDTRSVCRTPRTFHALQHVFSSAIFTFLTQGFKSYFFLFFSLPSL